MSGGERMKHIVFVIGNYKNGGVAMRSTNLANAFAQKDYSVTILVTGAISDDIYFDHHKNVEIVVLSEYIETHKQNADILKYKNKQSLKIKFIKLLRYITKHFKKLDPVLGETIKNIRKGTEIGAFALNNRDSIFIPFGISCYEKTFFAIKSFHSKIIYAERNASEVEFPKDATERERLIELVSKANSVVLQTQNELHFYGNKLKNPIVINNPVKADLPAVYEGERRKVIVNFCRVSKQKNLPLLFDAMKLLNNDYADYIL